MSRLRVLLIALILAPSTGCSWLREVTGMPARNTTGNTGPIQPVNANKLVDYVNSQADRLQSIKYSQVTVSTRRGLLLNPLPNLRGDLAASQPQSFRLIAEGGVVGAKVDMGSNTDLFWVSLHVPTQQPVFVYASHNDFESGKARLPEEMPFEPEWVMQALGMAHLPPGGQYHTDVDARARTYKLSWPAKLPSGVEVRKEIIFAVDDADPSKNQAQIKKHLIRDKRGNLICSAEVKSAKTLEAGGTDPHTNRPYVLQYPTEVVLRWEAERFEMTLKLDAAQVNQTIPPDEADRLFRLPDASRAGANPVNLAEARFSAPRR